MKFGTKMSAVC